MAHENDAQRAVHAGLGIVDALITTLNPHLARDTGVQLTVRLGVHTDAVVVGEMGGGRHEHLATGDTVNIAARLEGLAAPNTVVLSPVTARLVAGAFALDDLGLQTLKGVAETKRWDSCGAAGSRPKRAWARWCCSVARRASANRP